jgi:hypothetical protein
MLAGTGSFIAVSAVSGGGGGSYTGGALDTQTVTVGASGSAINEDRQRGFVLSALGGINDGTSNLYAGAAIRKLFEVETEGGAFDVVFEVAGVVANSGWTSMNVGGSSTLARASAIFSTSGGNSSWTWTDAGNLFGSSGTKIVGFD